MTPPGLCGRCIHARLVGNRRGSTFHLCGLSRRDRRFPRYPRLPVLRCTGFSGRGRVPAGGHEVASTAMNPEEETDE